MELNKKLEETIDPDDSGAGAIAAEETDTRDTPVEESRADESDREREAPPATNSTDRPTRAL